MKTSRRPLSQLASRPWFRIAVCIAIAALLAVFVARRPIAQDRPVPAAPPVEVAVVAAHRADLVDSLALAAEFRPFQDVSVHARVAGYVRRMRVDVGSRVKAGDVIAELEVPELQDELHRAAAAVARAEQETARARAQWDDAHLRHARLADVMQQQPNLVAQQEVDEARMRDAAAKSAWEAGRSAVQEAVAARAKLQTLLSYARITAPFDGVVTRRLADTGALVGAGTSAGGQAIVQLSQLDPLRLVVPLPESAVPRVRVGTPVTVQIPATGETVRAAVTRESGDVAMATRTMRVEVDVPNHDLHLAPGMIATAILDQERHDGVLALPIEAVPDRKDHGATLYVVDRGQHVQSRHAALGLETATQVEVTSGLGDGDLVVVGARGALHAGDPVRPRPLGEGRRP